MEIFEERYHAVLEDLYLEAVIEAKKEFLENKGEFSMAVLIFADFGLWLKNGRGIQECNVLCDFFWIVENIFFDKLGKIKANDLVEMLFFIVKRNLDNGILRDDKQYLYLPTNRNALEVKQVILKEFFDSKKSDLDKMVTILDTSLRCTEKEDAIYCSSYFDLDKMDEYKVAHTSIKEHYFDKLDSFSLDDIEVVIEAFFKLNDKFKSEREREMLSSFIRQYLEKKMKVRKVVVSEDVQKENLFKNVEEARNEQKEVLPNERVSGLKQKKVSTGISKKEEYEIKKTIESIFDFEKNVIKDNVVLSYDDIIKYNVLMVKAGYSEVERLRFVKVAYNFLTNNFSHPYAMLESIKHKLAFYGIIGAEIDEIITTIRQFLPEYMTLKVESMKRRGKTSANIDKELSDWEDIIRTEFGKLLNYVPKSGEFEQAEIKKLMNMK